MTQKPKPQKTSASVFVSTREKRGKAPRSTSPVAMPVTNGVTSPNEPVKGLDEYLIYKKLKEEVGEFYPYPGLWLEAPHDLLGGQTPLQLALSGPVGKEVVLNLIQMIKAGMFT